MRFICKPISIAVAFTVLVLMPSCSHFQKSNKFISHEEFAKRGILFKKLDFTERKKIDNFLNLIAQELSVAKKSRKIQPETWVKIGQTLEAYKILIQIREFGQLHVPEKTNLRLKLNSFCIDPSRASPESNEVFEWVPEEPSIPLYAKILRYYSIHPSVGKESIQELIWNLSNKTYYENYPDRLKNLLVEIDPDAPNKLPSVIKEKVTGIGISVLEDTTGVDLRGIAHFIQGKYYDFTQFQNHLENLRSSHKLKDERPISKIPETDIVVGSGSEGYKNQIFDFYNPSDEDQVIDISRYHLKPLRKDVQRIALASIVGDSDYYINLLNRFFKDTLAQLGVLYPNLTEKEKALIHQYPYESLRVAWHQARSEFAMGQFFEGGSIDGEADAFRHFVWAGFLTHDFGKDLAEQYLSAHESEQPVNSPDRRMDEHNNKKGVEAALDLDQQNRFSAKNLYEEAFRRLKNKDLIVLKPSGEVPDDSSY